MKPARSHSCLRSEGQVEKKEEKQLVANDTPEGVSHGNCNELAGQARGRPRVGVMIQGGTPAKGGSCKGTRSPWSALAARAALGNR
jgi:hypothetical protein